jgi:hypothetical protein
VPFSPNNYSEADIGNQLTRAITAIGKNNLQVAMYALVESLSMLVTIHPELGKLADWTSTTETRSGLASGTFRKSSINQEITGAILSIGRGHHRRAAEMLREAGGMLQWLAGTKNKALLVTTTPADQVER